MGLVKSIKKRFQRLSNVKFDPKTGFYRYSRNNNYIYIRHPNHFMEEKEQTWLCENLYFKHYLPQNTDVVVDLGAGYGEEANFLHAKSTHVNYFGVEAQPVIYECLSNTFHNMGKNFKSVPYVISKEPVKFKSQFSYASVSGTSEESYIEIPTIKWGEFLSRYNIHHIDLLKMNIEGAEKQILEDIDNFSIIKRLIISCHDFRANSGDGEHYRTKEFVLAALKRQGYTIKGFSYNISWADDWIYAEK